MASVKDLGGGKYRVFICNGFKPNGKVNRTSKVITAKSLRDAEKQANVLEVDFKRGQQVQLAHAPTFNDLVEKWREIKKPDMARRGAGVQRATPFGVSGLEHHTSPDVEYAPG